jgi:hypothetical protein
MLELRALCGYKIAIYGCACNAISHEKRFVLLVYFIITYLPTPWSRVLLEKLTGFAASQEIPRIYGTRKFVTVLTSACHLPASSSSHNPLPLPDDPS